MGRRHPPPNRIQGALIRRKQARLHRRHPNLRPAQTRHQHLRHRPKVLRRAGTSAVSERDGVLRVPHDRDALRGSARTRYAVFCGPPSPSFALLMRVTGQNTLLCRMVHQNMVPLRPAVHCPHIGPSGGGYCIDTPSYADTVGANYFSNYKFAYGNGSLSG